MLTRAFTILAGLGSFLALTNAALPPGVTGQYSRDTWVFAHLRVSGEYPAGSGRSPIAGTNHVVEVKTMAMWNAAWNSLKPPSPAPSPTPWDQWQVTSFELKIAGETVRSENYLANPAYYKKGHEASFRFSTNHFTTDSELDRDVQAKVTVKLWRSGEPTDQTTVNLTCTWKIRICNKLATWGTSENDQGEFNPNNAYSLASDLAVDDFENILKLFECNYQLMLPGDPRERFYGPILSSLESATGVAAFTHGNPALIRASQADVYDRVDLEWPEISASTDRSVRNHIPPPNFAIIYACDTMQSADTVKEAFGLVGNNKFLVGFDKKVDAVLLSPPMYLSEQSRALMLELYLGTSIFYAIFQVEVMQGLVARARDSSGLWKPIYLKLAGDRYSRVAGVYLGYDIVEGATQWYYTVCCRFIVGTD